jgi:putative nucleotidyltransferase with HDIG domain
MGGEFRGDIMNRDEALSLLERNVAKKTNRYHMLAVEAVMRGLANHLGEDEKLWSLTGLLHDIDYEKVGSAFEKHGLMAEEMLRSLSPPEDMIRAIKAHNHEHTGVEPTSRLDRALIAADAVSGLMVACALVMPSKSLAEVRVETVGKKYRKKDFARGVDRARLDVCEELGISKEQFFEIALESMKAIREQIGL